MIRTLRMVRAWFTRRHLLAAQVADLSARSDTLTGWLRRADARRGAEVAELRRELAACRREAESLDRGNQTLQAELRAERLRWARLAHRNAAAHRFAATLPAEQATELRSLLALRMPEEATRA